MKIETEKVYAWPSKIDQDGGIVFNLQNVGDELNSQGD